MHGKSDTAVRGGGRAATKEQLRIAQVTQDGPADEDRSRIQKMIKEIVETTRCSLAVAELALHDASNNVELAVNNILESEDLDTWTYKRKGTKKEEEREEPVKKGGNRGPRRGNQREQKGARATENGAEGRENRQPRDKEDGGFRGKRDQQPRNRREQGGKRDGKKPNANVEAKTESDDHWKNGPLVFNRRENIEDEKEQQQTNEPISKIIAKPSNAPLSFADVVRRNAQKPQPPPPQPAESQYKLQVDAKQTSPSPHSLSNADGLQTDENSAFGSVLPETSKSPRQLGHHLDIESSAGLLQDEPSPVTFGTQPSPQKMHQSLTEQLKTDLGLGAVSTAFGTSPSKKFPEPLHQQNKASTVKAGVVEFLSGDAPAATSGDWQFGFEAAPPQNVVSDEHSQFRRDNVSKVNEPIRNEIGLPSANINESNASRGGNASTVLNQYQQQPSSQYGGSSHQQPFNNRNNRNNGVNNLPFSNNYSDNFNSDLRSSYGAPSSPPKTQPIQQPLANLVSQQQSHHQQPPMFPYNYPYMNMYSPVGVGLRDDFAPAMLPFQYQTSALDSMMMIPQLNTSVGQPNHQASHHQNPPQQNVQQGIQHNQSSHSLQNQQSHPRNEHFDMKLFGNQQMNIPPASQQQQNNGSNGHNSQNSNLGNQQRQQPMLDNSQSSVPPPPGFPFFRNSFQVPFTQFPYVMPNAQHKSK